MVTPEPDGRFFIAFPDLPGCMTQGDRADEIASAADEICTLWIETAHERGLEMPRRKAGGEYSGTFVVRVPRTLHRDLAESAARERVRLNQYVATLLARGDALARVERLLAATDRRGELERAGDAAGDSLPKRRRGPLSVVGTSRS